MTDDPAPGEPDSRPDLDRAGTSDHLDPDVPGWVRLWEKLLDHLPMLFLTGLGVGTFGAVLLGWTVPRWLRIFALAAFAAGLLVGQPTATKVRELLWNPDDVYIIDLDATSRTGALYREPSQQFREWDVEDGQLDWWSPNLVAAKDVDFQNRTAVGTWRGTLTGRQLLAALDAVEECRGALEDQARRGRRIETQGFVIVRTAAVRATKQVIRTFERGTLPDEGEGLTAAIDDTLEELGLERRLDRLEEDPDQDQETDLDLDLSDLDRQTRPQEAAADD